MKKDGVKHYSQVSSVSTPEWTVVSSYELEPRKEAPVWGMSSSTFAAWELQAMSSTQLKCWDSSNNETAERLGGGTVESTVRRIPPSGIPTPPPQRTSNLAAL